MKKALIILTTCFVLASAFVLALFALNKKIVHEPNNFLRTYQKHVAVKLNELDLTYNSYYLAGITRDHVYFANVTAPFSLLVSNPTLIDTQRVVLKIKNPERFKFNQSLTVSIAPPYFYIADGSIPGIFRGALDEWNAEQFRTDSSFFSLFIPISSDLFAIRATAMRNKQLKNVLGTIQRDSSFATFNNTLLQEQVDGFFCTDGVLNYSYDLKRLIYTYYYRNEYIVYDTNLKLDYRGHTIDTFSRAQIKVGRVSSENASTLTSKKTINLNSRVSKNNLFINSNLLAKNDIRTVLDDYSIIDVYDLQNNLYKFSFLLPDMSPKDKVKDFMVFNNKTLIAMYNHHVVVYELKQEIFSRKHQ
jgi:hypothetical protein